MASLYVQQTGPTNAPIICFLHGFLGSGEDWQPIITVLSTTYNCIAIDLPGHGRSVQLEDEAYHFNHTAALVAEIAQQQKQRGCHVVGYSMGGRIALALAVMYPELIQSLTLLSASPGLASEQERIARQNSDGAIAKRLETENTEQFLRDWYTQPLFAALAANKPLLEVTIARRLQHDPKEWAKALRGTGTGIQPSYWEKLERIRIPTLLLTGKKDSKFIAIADMMKQNNTQFITEITPNAGHALHIEQPSVVAKHIRSFIAHQKGS